MQKLPIILYERKNELIKQLVEAQKLAIQLRLFFYSVLISEKEPIQICGGMKHDGVYPICTLCGRQNSTFTYQNSLVDIEREITLAEMLDYLSEENIEIFNHSFQKSYGAKLFNKNLFIAEKTLLFVKMFPDIYRLYVAEHADQLLCEYNPKKDVETIFATISNVSNVYCFPLPEYFEKDAN